MPTAHISAINLECHDAGTLARFWAEMLGGAVAVETPGFCAVNVDGLFLGAVRVDGYQSPTWPAGERPPQLHLDLAVDDLDAAEAEAVRLGAVKDDHQPSPDRSRVMRDPAGHPFCLRS